jgi:hypothetical protein
MARKKPTQRKLDVHVSDGLSEVIPPSRPKVEIVLEKLTVVRAKNWRIADVWCLDQACALFNGLEPLAGWEPDIELRKFVMQVETASLRNLIVRQFRDSPVPEKLAPIEWLELMQKAEIEMPDQLKSLFFGGELTEQSGDESDIKETIEQRNDRLFAWFEEEVAVKERGALTRVVRRESERKGKKVDRANIGKLIKKMKDNRQSQAKKNRLNNPVLPTSNNPFSSLNRGNNK